MCLNMYVCNYTFLCFNTIILAAFSDEFLSKMLTPARAKQLAVSKHRTTLTKVSYLIDFQVRDPFHVATASVIIRSDFIYSRLIFFGSWLQSNRMLSKQSATTIVKP